MILIILPVKNEQKTIEKTAIELYEWCKENLKDFEILFIDDGSEDLTLSLIKGLAIEKVRIAYNPFDPGKGSALKTGFVYANQGYQLKEDSLVVFMDGDGQIHPKEITPLLNLMTLYQADVAIGNKRHDYSVIEYGLLRGFVSVCYNLMVRVLFGISYRDTQCGIKIFKKHALDKVIKKVTVKKYAFDIELIIALRQMRMKIIDSPVVINPQVNKGSVSIGAILNTFFDTLIVWFKFIRGYYV